MRSAGRGCGRPSQVTPAWPPSAPSFGCCTLTERGHYATLRLAEGTRQGRVLGMPLFALAFARFGALSWTEEKCSHQGNEGIPFAFADDTYVVGVPQTLMEILDEGPGALDAFTGLRMNVEKSEALRQYTEYVLRGPRSSPPPPPLAGYTGRPTHYAGAPDR